MIVKLDTEAVKVIETILKNGKDVIVRRERDGILILEQTRKIAYRNATRIGE